MNVSLTKELQKFVQDQVKSGLYRSSSEVIRDCVRRFRQDEAQIAVLRREIEKGLQDIEAGRVEELDMEGIISEARILHANRKKNAT